MMGLDERVAYLLLGLIIGFVLGYLTRLLRSVDQKEDEVLKILKNDKDDRGRVDLSKIKERLNFERIALAIVVFLAFFAAVQSQMNTNAQKEDQNNLVGVVGCIQETFSQTLVSVNERTTYSSSQAQANIALQQAQSQFIQDALREPALDQQRVAAALSLYFDKLREFVSLQTKTVDKQQQNPYPTDEELAACIAGEMRPE